MSNRFSFLFQVFSYIVRISLIIGGLIFLIFYDSTKKEMYFALSVLLIMLWSSIELSRLITKLTIFIINKRTIDKTPKESLE